MASGKGEARGRPLRDREALLAKRMAPAAAELNVRLLELLGTRFPGGRPYQRLAELEDVAPAERQQWTKNLSERLSPRKKYGADWETVELILRHTVAAEDQEQRRAELADLWEASWGYPPGEDASAAPTVDATAGQGSTPAEPAGQADDPPVDDPADDTAALDDSAAGERAQLVAELDQARGRISTLTTQLASYADEARDSRAQLHQANAVQRHAEVELADTREQYAQLVGEIQLHPDAAAQMTPLPQGTHSAAAGIDSSAPLPARALGAYLEAWAAFRHLTTAVIATSGGGNTEIVERLFAGQHLPPFPLVACIARIVGADHEHTEKLYMRAEPYMRPDPPARLSRPGTSITTEVLAADPDTLQATFDEIVNASLNGAAPSQQPVPPTVGHPEVRGATFASPTESMIGRYYGQHRRARHRRITPPDIQTLRERFLLPVGLVMISVLLGTLLIPTLTIAWLDRNLITLQYTSGDQPNQLNTARIGTDDVFEWMLLPGQTTSTTLRPTRAGRRGHLHGDLGSVQFTVLSCAVQMEWVISSGHTVLSHGTITGTAQTIQLSDVLSPAVTPRTPLRLTVTRTDWMPCRTALRWTHAGITARPLTPPLTPRQLQH